MRRPVRGIGMRLIAVLFAALTAAPQASAAPARVRDIAPNAATAAWPAGNADTQVQRRGHVVVSELLGADQTARPSRDLPRLPWRTGGPGPVAPSGPVTIAAAPREAATTDRPPIVTPPFDGFAEGGPFTADLEPPDPWVAVGPDHVVQVVNVGLRITDRQGLNATETSLASFFGSRLGTSTPTRG